MRARACMYAADFDMCHNTYQVSKADFDRALEEVRPAFGVNSDDLQVLFAGICAAQDMQHIL